MGSVAASIHDIKPAKEIVEEMVRDAVTVIKNGAKLAKL
jgi:hypothetical protein